jgi:flavin-dependent dehydrogenase
MVMREEFDALLLAQSGAEVLDGHPVTGVIESGGHVQVQTAARSFTGRYAVGADGAASSVARWLGLREHRQLSPTLEAEVAPSRAAGRFAEYGQQAVFSLGVVPWGYAWVFPKNGALSVGIGRVRPGRLDLRAALWREMERLGLPPAGVELHGHPLPCYQAPLWPLWSPWVRGARPVPGWPQERLSTDRCLLVGDAAGLVDPLIGEGIRYAVGSALLAAEAIAGGDLSSYEAAVWWDIGRSLATAQLTAGVAYRWPKLTFRLGLRNPATTHLFVKILTGQMSHVGTGRKLLGNAVRSLLRGEPDHDQ